MATHINNNGTAANVSGSNGTMPYSWLAMSGASASAPARPMATPTTLNRAA